MTFSMTLRFDFSLPLVTPDAKISPSRKTINGLIPNVLAATPATLPIRPP